MKIKKDKRLVKFKDYALLFLGLILVIFLVSCVDKPEVVMQWYRTFGSGDEVYGKSVQQTADGGYIVCGIKESYGPFDQDVWLIKTDAEGNKLWSKTFGGERGDVGISAQQTRDGGYIICGSTKSYTAGDEDIWLIKTDADGNKLWDKTFGGNGYNAGRSVQQTTDGGYIICGYRDPYADGDGRAWLIKTDADGNKLWDRTFGGEAETTATSVQQTKDGGYIICGMADQYETGKTEGLLIKTDAAGNQLWEKTFGGKDVAIGNSVQQTTDGGYIIGGRDGNRLRLIKTDTDGNTIWDKTFIGQELNIANSVGQTTDGGYIVCGSTWPLEGEGGGYISRQNVRLIKTDADGNKLWDRTFGGELFASGQSVQQTADGGYIIGGTGDTEKTIGWPGPLLIKTDSNGSELWSKVLYSDRNKLLDKILGTYSGYSYSAQQTTDGGYIVCATKESENVWLIKTDADGNKLWEKTFDKEIKEPAIAYSIQQTTDGGYIVSGNTYSEGSRHTLLLKIAPER